MSRPTPRRPASSRGVTPRPRRIAGQTVPRTDDAVEVEAPAAAPEEADTAGAAGAADAADAAAERPSSLAGRARADVVRRAAATLPAARRAERPAADRADGTEEPGGESGLLARPRTTRTLLIVLAALTIVLAAQAVWWARHLTSDDDTPSASDDTALSVPDGRPVVAAPLQTVDGVEAAAKAAQQIVAVDFNKYDAEVDEAAALMTADFEKQYRETAGDIEEQFVAQKTVVQANVVAQGVVRANRTRLEALVFLNQVVSREREGKPETVVTPFKVLVTMVHTDQGWFVDDLQTDETMQDTAD